MSPEQEAARWLVYAEEDLAYGHLGLESYPRAAAWSFQQATEKALKACLISQGKVPPRTHDLILLQNTVGIKPDADTLDAVVLLAEISAASRYPDDLEPVDRELARQYAHAADAVVKWAAQSIRELGE
jgi:HEPN domain-containing protein